MRLSAGNALIAERLRINVFDVAFASARFHPVNRELVEYARLVADWEAAETVALAPAASKELKSTESPLPPLPQGYTYKRTQVPMVHG